MQARKREIYKNHERRQAFMIFTAIGLACLLVVEILVHILCLGIFGNIGGCWLCVTTAVTSLLIYLHPEMNTRSLGWFIGYCAFRVISPREDED